MREYWALAPREEIANEIETQWTAYHTWMQNTGLKAVIQELYNAYYSFGNGGFGIAKSVNGSTAKIKVQHMKSLLQRIKSLATQAKLTYVPKAINSDSSTQLEADFAKGLLDFYEDDKNMTDVIADMVEKGLVVLDSYVYAAWDFSKGEMIREGHFAGDQTFKVLTRFDVASHTTEKESQFYIIRELVNKYDLASMYPEQRDNIIAAGFMSQPLEYISNPLGNRSERHLENDTCEIYTLFHAKTPAVPQGRMTLICNGEVLADVAMPYRVMPIVHFQPGKIHETVVGDSPATSLLSLQQGIDALYSAVISNNLQYSRQNIWSPSAIQVEPLSEGFNNIVSAQEPKALQLVASSPETYNLIQVLQTQQQLLSGVNDTARGAPEASLKSGTSLALMLSVSIQFVNEIQKAYAAAAGQLATIVIANLQEFAKEPRLAYIGGQSRKSAIKEFTAKDLQGIKRISCDIGNPLTQNIAGRYELVQQFQQFGVIRDPKKLIEFMRTGQIDSLTEDQFKDTILTRSENEMMRKGEEPIVMVTDIHPAHIIEHKALADDPEMRKDPRLMAVLAQHIQSHIDQMKNMDPDLAAILGMQPLPSQQMAPPSDPGSEQLEMPPEAPGMQPDQARLPPLPEGTPSEFQEGVA